MDIILSGGEYGGTVERFPTGAVGERVTINGWIYEVRMLDGARVGVFVGMA